MLNLVRSLAFLGGVAVLVAGAAAPMAFANPGPNPGASAAARPAASPVGTWSTANGHGVIAIARCGEALCGRIVGIDRKPTEPMPTDVHGRSQCGLTIITNQRLKSDGTWSGEITDPRDGATYRANIWLDEGGNLHLRGYIGIPLLGSTQVWRPFNRPLTAECGLA